MFKLLFLILPPTRKTWSSSTTGSSNYDLLFCLTFANFLLFAEPSELSFTCKFSALCHFDYLFFQEPQFQQHLEVVLMFQSLFGKAFLSKFVLNFKTNTNTLPILFQLNKRVSNVSSISAFISILLTKTLFLV